MSKRQQQPKPTTDTTPTATTSATDHRSLPGADKAPTTAWTEAALNRLVLRAQQGDEASMRELRQAMQAYPALERQFTDMAAIARQQITESTFGKHNILLKESLDHKLAALRRELEGPSPTPLELLLVERIITCWTAVYLADIAASTSGLSITKAAYLDKRADRAHHRYLASLIALARVRRLLAPTIAQVNQVHQVNIAQAGAQQLNAGLLAATSPEGASPHLPQPSRDDMPPVPSSSPRPQPSTQP